MAPLSLCGGGTAVPVDDLPAANMSFPPIPVTAMDDFTVLAPGLPPTAALVGDGALWRLSLIHI